MMQTSFKTGSETWAMLTLSTLKTAECWVPIIPDTNTELSSESKEECCKQNLVLRFPARRKVSVFISRLWLETIKSGNNTVKFRQIFIIYSCMELLIKSHLYLPMSSALCNLLVIQRRISIIRCIN